MDLGERDAALGSTHHDHRGPVATTWRLEVRADQPPRPYRLGTITGPQVAAERVRDATSRPATVALTVTESVQGAIPVGGVVDTCRANQISPIGSTSA